MFQTLLDAALELRIRLQRPLLAARRLPPLSSSLSSSSSSSSSTALTMRRRAASRSIVALLRTLDVWRCAVSADTESVFAANSNVNVNNDDDDDDDDDDDNKNNNKIDNDNYNDIANDNDMSSSALWPRLDAAAARAARMRSTVLTQLSARLAPSSGSKRRTDDALIDIEAAVDRVMVDRERVLKRTRTTRSTYRVLGETEPRALFSIHDDVFDDGDFYATLLQV